MIKEYVELSSYYHYIARKESYSSQLSAFLEMYDAVQQDFPNLTPEAIKIIHYGGDRYRRTWGIEFTLLDAPPEGYIKIKEVELTL